MSPKRPHEEHLGGLSYFCLRSPLFVLLPLQAALLFWNLDLLSIWSDEAFTVNAVRQRFDRIPAFVATDIHPPLYYLLLKIWSAPADSIAWLRSFSGACALASTVALDRLWLRNLRPRRRWAVLVLFALSPCLLLYGRMARSYALQVLLTLVAVWALRQWQRRSGRLSVAIAGSVALLYTHYVPAIAILIAFLSLNVRRLPIKSVLLFAAGVVLGYLPWLLTLAAALAKWQRAESFFAAYAITGAAWTEQILKLGFAAVSLAIGESWHPAALLLVVPFWLVVAAYIWNFARLSGRLPLMLVLAAVIGYIGVSRWVTYPFIPARLLWLLPFLVMAIGLARTKWLIRLLVVSAMVSIGMYFSRAGYMNVGYAAPLREIAASINLDAAPGDAVILDAYNADAAISLYLKEGIPVILLTEDRERDVRSLVARSRNVWIVAGSRDISPDRITTRMQEAACGSAPSTNSRNFLPYTAWQRAILSVLGVPADVTHHYRVTKCTLR